MSSNRTKWVVAKFGGTSVNSQKNWSNIVQITKTYQQKTSRSEAAGVFVRRKTVSKMQKIGKKAINLLDN